MLKSTTTSKSFDIKHWVDANKSLTTLQANISEYFEFTTKDFYVQINSTKMSFYDNSQENNKEVVYISNESANIDGLTVDKDLTVNCPSTFNFEVDFFGFKWKKEDNDKGISLLAPPGVK